VQHPVILFLTSITVTAQNHCGLFFVDENRELAEAELLPGLNHDLQPFVFR
jgi:hypothetical protein